MTPERLISRLAKVESMREEILAAGDEAQQLRRLPDSIVARLIDEGFFRFTLPEELGGEDATSRDTIIILEAMAAIDASVAWNVMLGSEINAMAAGGMDKDLARHQANDLVCRNTAIGTANPKNFGTLFLGQISKKRGILLADFLGPLFVVFHQVEQFFHV